MKNNFISKLILTIFTFTNFTRILPAAQEPIKKAKKQVRFANEKNIKFLIPSKAINIYNSISYTLSGEILFLDYKPMLLEYSETQKLIDIKNRIYEPSFKFTEFDEYRVNPTEPYIVTISKRSKKYEPWAKTNDDESIDLESEYRLTIDIGAVNVGIKQAIADLRQKLIKIDIKVLVEFILNTEIQEKLMRVDMPEKTFIMKFDRFEYINDENIKKAVLPFIQNLEIFKKRVKSIVRTNGVILKDNLGSMKPNSDPIREEDLEVTLDLNKNQATVVVHLGNIFENDPSLEE